MKKIRIPVTYRVSRAVESGTAVVTNRLISVVRSPAPSRFPARTRNEFLAVDPAHPINTTGAIYAVRVNVNGDDDITDRTRRLDYFAFFASPRRNRTPIKRAKRAIRPRLPTRREFEKKKKIPKKKTALTGVGYFAAAVRNRYANFSAASI